MYDENLNAQRYVRILQENIIEPLDDMPLAQRYHMFFQHDGAPPHNSHIVRELLNHNFGDNWIGTYGPNRWPPRSPDLTPIDFYFWGDLKDKIYKYRANNVEELREHFENYIQRVSNIHIYNATRSIAKRCQLCINENGRQFEHLL
uniref:Transposable element Tc1 transposase n=1 Tax=Anoplophora glabripennis TaxID=217634 RepID=V5GSF2_ANOGL